MIKYSPIIQKISSNLFLEKKINVSVLRLDLIHPSVSGNKWFKLKYNIAEAKKYNQNTILTFGGAFSNHIHATAAACKLTGIKSIGVIRGERASENNSTLSFAKQNGMQLHFVSRDEYRKKDSEEFINELKSKFGNFYLIPEGGNNELGEKGCEEIIKDDFDFDYLFCACGTNTMFNGLSRRDSFGTKKIKPHQKIMGIRVIKSNLKEPGINNDYSFGGYAKHTQELLDFKKQFEKQNNIPLDYVYTAKLFYAVNNLISKNYFEEGAKILIIHSGGLQGNDGYEQRYNLNPNL